MTIGGLQKLSLSDFPGRIAAIVFTRGCNFRCPYCHNPELVDPARYARPVSSEEVLAFLGRRRHLLQGVVVSGGEPTIHDDLDQFLEAVRSLGFAVKLDTNGSRPDELARILAGGLVDYVALDVKAPEGSYGRVAGVPVDPTAIVESLRIVRESRIDHEARTTYAPQFLSHGELQGMAGMLRGCRRFALQAFRPSKALDPGVLDYGSPSANDMEEARRIFESAGVPVTTR